MTTNVTAILQAQVANLLQYLENAQFALQSGEAGKAGELFWGSVALATQALATSMNRRIGTHRDLKNFALQLAKDLNDEDIKTNFLLAESLHHNFYEVQLEPQDVALVVPAVRELVSKLLSLIPKELLEKPAII